MHPPNALADRFCKRICKPGGLEEGETGGTASAGDCIRASAQDIAAARDAMSYQRRPSWCS